jgi:hypothetical protein
MAYRYNERTGEFEDIPQSIPRSSTRGTETARQQPSSSGQEPAKERFEGFFAGLLGLFLRIGMYALMYLAFSGLVSLCSH